MKDGGGSSEKKLKSTSDRKGEGARLWGVVLFGLIGATAVGFAVGQFRRTVDWFAQQANQTQSSWKRGTNSSFRSAFQQAAWRKYQRRLQEEYEEEMARVERIRRMQDVFNREREKHKRGYERWRESDHGAYHQYYQRDGWYWTSDTSFGDQSSNFKQTPRSDANYTLSQHYAVLGLDRSPSKPYTEAEIKTVSYKTHFIPDPDLGFIRYPQPLEFRYQSAFRAKAMEFHPDQHQNDKDAAEAKFKEVLTSYEAIKSEMKSMSL